MVLIAQTIGGLGGKGVTVSGHEDFFLCSKIDRSDDWHDSKYTKNNSSLSSIG